MKIKYLFTTYLKNIIMILKTTNNWLGVLLYRARCLNRVSISFRDGDHILVDKGKCEWINILSIIELKYLLKDFRIFFDDNGNYSITLFSEITFVADNVSLSDTLFLINEQYYKDNYRVKDLSLKDQIVIDIGANIGDTALLFALKGAVVFAFEPIPASFKRLKINIAANNIGKYIIPFNVGLSDMDKELDIAFNPSATVGISTIENINTGYFHREKVKLVEAIKYFKNNNISHCDLLKIDCEGCENILLKDSSLIKYLNPGRVIVEYHNGNDINILPILREHYDNIEILPSADYEKCGMIYANVISIKNNIKYK